MYYYVYVLKCGLNRLYVGYTTDLKRRYEEHKNDRVYSTKRLKVEKIIFYEAFLDKGDALRRESYFKTTKGKRSLRLMLKKYFSEN